MERRSVLVSGSIAKILTTVVDSRTFDVHEMRHETRSLLKRDGTWTVEAGDTGNGIAARLSIQFIQLAFLNPAVDWNNLQIGQELMIPCSEDSLPSNNTTTSSSFYNVVAGDTGDAIAENHGISFNQLQAFNPGCDWYNLQVGQTLIVPGQQMANNTPGQATDMQGEEQNANTPATATQASNSSTTTTTTSTAIATDFAAQHSNPFLQPPSGYSHSLQSKDTVAGHDQSNKALNTYSKTSTTLISKALGAVSSIIPIVNMGNTTTTIIRPATTTANTVQSGGISATSSQTYVVKAGDTGYAIAAVYGFPFSDLDNANPGVVWTNLRIGQVLNLPTHATLPYANSSTTAPPTNPTSPSSGISTRKSGMDIYITYSGPASNASYPLISSWMSFQDMWTANQNYVGASCSFASGSVPPNTASETEALKNSILSVSGTTGVNPSFILALVMQESNGCVRVPTTSSWEGITNPGLTQSFKGTGTCNSNGKVLQPCPSVEITQMLTDGIAGSQGVGIVPALNQVALLTGQSWNQTVPATINTTATTMNATSTATATTTANARVTTAVSNQKNLNNANIGQNRHVKQRGSSERSTQTSTGTLDEAMLYYMAARIYNSGSIPADMDLSGPTGSTQCYVSDIVNRLLGWVAAPRACTPS